MQAKQVWGTAEEGFPDERTGLCPTGSIVLRVGGGRRVLSMAGEIDLCVVDRFQRSRGVDSPQADAIDAGDVTFIGAAGLRLMAQAAQASAAAGRPVVLSRSSRCVDHLLHLVGLQGLLQR